MVIMTRQQTLRLLKEDDGPTAVEYAVLLALILMAVFLSVTAVGNSTSGLWQKDSEKVYNATHR
jgi:pilus assembly protein Flp/PilA